MANELTTVVPGPVPVVKSSDRLLNQNDVAILIGRPVRWVREKLFKTGVLRSVRFGANEWRTKREWLDAMIERGATGFKNAKRKM